MWIYSLVKLEEEGEGEGDCRLLVLSNDIEENIPDTSREQCERKTENALFFFKWAHLWTSLFKSYYKQISSDMALKW